MLAGGWYPGWESPATAGSLIPTQYLNDGTIHLNTARVHTRAQFSNAFDVGVFYPTTRHNRDLRLGFLCSFSPVRVPMLLCKCVWGSETVPFHKRQNTWSYTIRNGAISSHSFVNSCLTRRPWSFRASEWSMLDVANRGRCKSDLLYMMII